MFCFPSIYHYLPLYCSVLPCIELLESGWDADVTRNRVNPFYLIPPLWLMNHSHLEGGFGFLGLGSHRHMWPCVILITLEIMQVALSFFF